MEDLCNVLALKATTRTWTRLIRVRVPQQKGRRLSPRLIGTWELGLTRQSTRPTAHQKRLHVPRRENQERKLRTGKGELRATDSEAEVMPRHPLPLDATVVNLKLQWEESRVREPDRSAGPQPHLQVVH
jgi:hypothetical protein